MSEQRDKMLSPIQRALKEIQEVKYSLMHDQKGVLRSDHLVNAHTEALLHDLEYAIAWLKAEIRARDSVVRNG